MDYTRLRDLLAAENWKDADYETYLVMLKVVGRKEGDWIREEELLNFPCTDLRTIDRLWVKYTNGRFGFSVQKKIYLEVGGKPDGRGYPEAWENPEAWKKYSDHVWEKYSDRVGWEVEESRRYSEVIFDTTTPLESRSVRCEGWIAEVIFDTTAPLGHLPLFSFCVPVVDVGGRSYWSVR